MRWQELQAELDADNARLVDEAPEEVVKVVKFRIEESGAGTDGQIMGTWFYTLTDVRYLSDYLYQIVLAAMNPEFTADQIKYLMREMMPGAGAYVGYSGFASLWNRIKGVIDVMDEIERRDDLVDLLDSLHFYASHLKAYIHHYFPWCIALLYPHRTPEDVQEMVKLLADV
jgi:hypothetical protein